MMNPAEYQVEQLQFFFLMFARMLSMIVVFPVFGSRNVPWQLKVGLAFFLSLVMVILVLPWQIIFDGIIPGVIYTPCELPMGCSSERSGIFAITIHYLRFTGYWLLAILFLIFAQLRSGRWTKSVLRRLEVI